MATIHAQTIDSENKQKEEHLMHLVELIIYR